MPVQAPFFKSPTNPQHCNGFKSFAVYCRAKPGIVEKYLEPTPFSPLGDDFVITFGDYSNNDAAAFYDAAIVVPARYKGVTGGYVLFEYEDLVSSVAGGRELWGYPKKEADFEFADTGDFCTARVIRQGNELMSLRLDFTAGDRVRLPEIQTHPHLLLLTMPRYAGPGIQSQKILSRDSSPDLIVKSKKLAAAEVRLSGCEKPPVIEPLDEWQPVEVYGASFVVADYSSTDEHGYANLVDVIVADPDR